MSFFSLPSKQFNLKPYTRTTGMSSVFINMGLKKENLFLNLKKGGAGIKVW